MDLNKHDISKYNTTSWKLSPKRTKFAKNLKEFHHLTSNIRISPFIPRRNSSFLPLFYWIRQHPTHHKIQMSPFPLPRAQNQSHREENRPKSPKYSRNLHLVPSLNHPLAHLPPYLSHFFPLKTPFHARIARPWPSHGTHAHGLPHDLTLSCSREVKKPKNTDSQTDIPVDLFLLNHKQSSSLLLTPYFRLFLLSSYSPPLHRATNALLIQFSGQI